MKKFTLIELLIVIGIISILTSILLPSLQNALRSTKSSVCLNNEKQINIAMVSYADDNSLYFPSGSESTETWDDLIGDGYDGRNNDSSQSLNEAYKLYSCPLDRVARSTNKLKRSYSINSLNARGLEENTGNHLGIASFSYISRRYSDIPFPSNTIAIFDYHRRNNWLGQNGGSRVRLAEVQEERDNASFWRHGFGKLNFLMVDGSAKNLDLTATLLGKASAWDGSNVAPANTMWDAGTKRTSP